MIAVGVISPAKSDLIVGEGNQAMVGDGDAMGIAGEIAEDMMGTAEGWFGVDNPLVTEQGAQEGVESFMVLQRTKRAGEDELLLLESEFESVDELAAKDTAEHFHGEEEGIAGMDPAVVVGGKTSGRNQTVQVRMEQHVLSPTMQHSKETDVCAEMLGISGNLEQGLGGGMKQQVVEDLFIDQSQMREMMRHGEDDVDIRNW